MKDTTEAVKSEYYRRIAVLSTTERGKVLAATVHNVRQILWAQLQHLTEFERRQAFLQRLYGRDLSPEQIRRAADISSAAPMP